MQNNRGVFLVFLLFSEFSETSEFSEFSDISETSEILEGANEVVHSVASPCVGACVGEAAAQVEVFGAWVALIDEQSCGQSHLSSFVDGGGEQLSGDALSAMVLIDAEGVEVEFACLCLVGHVGEVAPEGLFGFKDEGLSQGVEHGAVVTDGYAYEVVSLGGGLSADDGVGVAVLAVGAADEMGEQSVEVVERVMGACEPLAALVVHGFHGERGYARGIGGGCGSEQIVQFFNPFKMSAIFCLVATLVGTRGSRSTFSIMPMSLSSAFTPAGLPSTKSSL